MRRVINLALITVVIISLATVVNILRPKTYSTSTAPLTQNTTQGLKLEPKPTVSELLKLVNQERVRVGVAPLALDERLNQSAQLKADDMVRNKYQAHVNPLTGKHGYEYIPEAGLNCFYHGENLSWFHKNAEVAVKDWKLSESHYKAMIDSQYELTGFGIAGNNIIVQHFCNI